MKVSIFPWIAKKLKQCMAITQDGDTADRAIASGKYVCWKSDMYTANQAINSGDTLSAGSGGNLTAVDDGIANDLNSEIATLNSKLTTQTYNPTFSNASKSGWEETTNVISKFGNIIHVFFDFTMTGNVSAWTTFIRTDIPISNASFEKNCGIGIATTEAQSSIQITEYLRALVENGKLVFRPSINLTSGKRYRSEVTLILP